MKTSIITINGGFAVQNEDGSFVGFGATREIAERIKAKADKATADLAQWLETEQEWHAAGYTGKRLANGAFDIPCCAPVAVL